MTRALITQMLEALGGVTRYVHNNLSSDYPTGVDTQSKEFDAADKAITAAREYLAEPEQSEPVDKSQWWYTELRDFWGSADHVVTLDTRRAAKVALDYVFRAPQPTDPADDDLTIAYMAGYHKGKTDAQPAELTDEQIRAIVYDTRHNGIYDTVRACIAAAQKGTK